MPNCKICGKPVLSARVMHPACWERACDKMAEIFCDEYCKWPGECADKDALAAHCDDCALIRILNLGL
ncbi:MAG: hypothetical protein RR825_00890 [Ruthenibacterium sp.]